MSKTLDEWQKLRDAVKEILQARQRAALPDVFWIDGKFNDVVSQRVIVYDPKFLKPELMRELSASIDRLKLLGAQIEVLFNFSEDEGVSSDYLRGLLIAHANGVDEAVFSLPDLRHRYGSSFYSD